MKNIFLWSIGIGGLTLNLLAIFLGKWNNDYLIPLILSLSIISALMIPYSKQYKNYKSYALSFPISGCNCNTCTDRRKNKWEENPSRKCDCPKCKKELKK